MGDVRLLVTLAPSPWAVEFTAVVEAVTRLYPGLPMTAFHTADDGAIEVWVPADARPADPPSWPQAEPEGWT